MCIGQDDHMDKVQNTFNWRGGSKTKNISKDDQSQDI